MKKVMSDEQLDKFREDGFLVVPDFLDDQSIQAMRDRMIELVDTFDPDQRLAIFQCEDDDRGRDRYFLESGDKIHFFFEKDAIGADGSLVGDKHLGINKVGHALHGLDPTFKQVADDPRLVDLCRQLGLTRPHIVQSMYLFKQPHIGDEVTCHQDATFLYTEPESTVGFWFALEDATIANGCLFAAPGGHRGPKRQLCRRHGNAMEMVTLDDTPWPMDGMKALEVAKGSMVVLDGLLPHMSYPNRSKNSRHALTLHFVDGQADFSLDNWIRPFGGKSGYPQRL